MEKRLESAALSAEAKPGGVDAKSAFLAHRGTAAPPSRPEMQLAGNMAATGRSMKQSGSLKKDSASASMGAAPGLEYGSSPAANKLEADKSALSESVGKSSTTGEVASGAEIASTERAPSSEPSMMARADGLTLQDAPKIEKAKPALDETTGRDAALNGKVNESQKRSEQKALAPSAVGEFAG